MLRSWKNQKMEFEKEKLERELEVEKQKLAAETELEEQKLDLEKKRLEEEHQKWLTTLDQERRRDKRKNQKLDIMKEQNELKKQQEEATKSKLLGDVIRNSIIKMSADPIEAPAFFTNAEQLFRMYSVPKNLQARLISPYLNEKAQKIVGKLRAEVASDYKQMKDTVYGNLNSLLTHTLRDLIPVKRKWMKRMSRLHHV